LLNNMHITATVLNFNFEFRSKHRSLLCKIQEVAIWTTLF